MKYSMDRVAGGSFPQQRFGQDLQEYYGQIEKMVEGVKRTGTTHIMINQAICAIPRVIDPQNSYMQFMEFGYCMNQFVRTSYDKDIYYEKMRGINRDLLLANGVLARKYGLRCYIMCVEPTFMQESLFDRYPHWRGPRVDNPACSHKPLFAPCVNLPDVLDYYCQEIRGMLKLVPEIDEIHIFTNDTSGGFCYSSGLYAGPNGPVHCRNVSPGKHAQKFCKALLDAGRELNPDFRVIMTSGLSPYEKADFIEGAPEGICSSVYGAFAWGGGLEDYWGTMAVGPKVFNNSKERKKIREWVYADMRARFKPLKANNTPLYVSYSPLYYRGDDPRPLETYRIICDLLEMGIDNIIGGAPQGKYSVNGAVMRRAMMNGREDIEVVLLEIASDWVGANCADKLVEAWRAADHGSCEQPMLAHSGHSVMLEDWVRHMPLVPDDTKLSDKDLDYFMTAIIRDQDKMWPHAGGVWRIFHYDQQTIEAYIRQYDEVTLPDYGKALDMINECLSVGNLTETATACLETQKASIEQWIHAHSHIRSWLLAAFHKHKHLTVPEGFPSLQEVIDMQIQLAGDRDSDRISLMKQHRDDPLLEIDLTMYPVHKHPGAAGWEGAHEKAHIEKGKT